MLACYWGKKIELGERERENIYYSKTPSLWKIVSIDDFLCYRNRASFFYWDCPKQDTKVHADT